MSDNHTDSEQTDHHDDEHDHDAVLSEFHLWTQIPSTTLLIIVLIVGSLANTFVCYCLYKKKIGTSYLNPVLLLISVKNLCAITICIPLAIVMVNVPTTIQKVTCSIQEDITYIIVFAGYLFPALLSVIQCDRIVRHHRAFFNSTRVKIVLCIVSSIAVILGMQSQIQDDEHGCHLWSISTDQVVLTYIYSVAIIVGTTIVTMTTSYILIYYHTRAHQNVISQMPQTSTNGRPTGEGNSNVQTNPNNEASTIKRYVPYRRKKSTSILKPMFCIVGSNLLTSLPWIILYTSTMGDELASNVDYAELRVLTMSIIYIPIAAEPVIFLAFSTKGKQALKTVWNNMRNKTGTVTPNQTGVSAIPAAASDVA